MTFCSWCVDGDVCSFAKLNDGNLPITQCYMFKVRSTTNGDRLRSLPDEELAKAIARKITSCYGCRATNELECAECVLEWLKQEATT